LLKTCQGHCVEELSEEEIKEFKDSPCGKQLGDLVKFITTNVDVEVARLIGDPHNPSVNADDPRCLDPEGDTPLHKAAHGGHLGAVAVLLEAGFDINKRNKFNNHPLHWAAMEGHEKVVEYLVVQKDQNPMKNKFQRYPYDMAVQRALPCLPVMSKEEKRAARRSIKAGYSPRLVAYNKITRMFKDQISLYERLGGRDSYMDECAKYKLYRNATGGLSGRLPGEKPRPTVDAAAAAAKPPADTADAGDIALKVEQNPIVHSSANAAYDGATGEAAEAADYDDGMEMKNL